MRNAILALAGLFMLATVTQAQDKAQALLDKAITARGGADKLNKLKGWQSKTKGKLAVAQLGGETEFIGETAVQLPDKSRITLNLQAMGMEITVRVIMNGNEGWRDIMGMTQEITGPEMKARAAAQYVDRMTLLTPLKDKQFTLAALDEIKVGDKPAVGIKVTAKDRPDVKLYFDTQSNLLVRVESTVTDPMSGGEVASQTTMSKHKAFDGIQFPTKLVVMRDGKLVQEVEVLEFKLADQLDAKLFEKP